VGNPHRDRPLRTKQPKRKVEEDLFVLDTTKGLVPVPEGSAAFKEGFRECVELFALHRPNKRGVRRILEDYSITLEDACMRAMTRENVARYEGYRAAMKELKARKLVKRK